MKMTSKQIRELNDIAQIDFGTAQAMLDGINMVLGTKYGWLAKRVVLFEKPDAHAAEKYAHTHDAYASAWYEETYGTAE